VRADQSPAPSPVGSHVFSGRGIGSYALPQALELGAEAVQVFVGNPRGWALSAGRAEEDERFRKLCAEHDIAAFVHTPYLVNLGSPTASTYRSSVDSIAHNLNRALQIGARGVVVHTGSCVADGNVDTAMRQVREGLLRVLDALDDDSPALLLEPTAGQGRSLCAGVEDLASYLDALDRHPRVGICLDTCHVFAAGAPLDQPGGMTTLLDRLAEVAGPGRLQLVHANDSKDRRGSFRDRHERIGAGSIGTGAFAELFAHPAVAGVPVVLEVPGGPAGWGEDLALLKSLRAPAAGGAPGGRARGAAAR
jgi:deoxyribonuclease-4